MDPYIKIETDEDGFWLVIQGITCPLRHPISDPEGFYDHVKAVIGPWLRERDEVSAQAWRTVADDLQRAAYDISDPKHPDFHSIHADLYDQDEGK